GAEPILNDEVWKSRLDDRRHIVQGRDPLWSGHRKRTQLAGRNQVNDRKRGDELIVIDSTDQIRNGLRQALIRDVGGAHAGLQLEHFTSQVGGRAKAAGGESELVWPALEQGDKLLQRLGWQRGMDDQDLVCCR